MRLLVIFGILAFLALAACSNSSGGGSGGGSGLVSTPVATPSPTPEPSPTPSPTPVTCQPFQGTDWVADGLPTLTAESANQPGVYIAEFNMSDPDPIFTEIQYIPGAGNVSCMRHFNAGAGGIDNITWSDSAGGCASVANWLQFSMTNCNEITLIIRDGLGSIYETQLYKVK